MNIKHLLVPLLFLIFFQLSCNPSREEYGLSPIILISETSQKNLARTLLSRSFELTQMTDTLQRGFALPTPYYDSTLFHRSDSIWYTRQINDTIVERVRFIPDIWRFPNQIHDSIFYEWYYSPTDTLRSGTYWYSLITKRIIPPDSLCGLRGTATFYYRFYTIASDGYWYNYSYYLRGTFSLAGGTPPPLDQTSFQWTGIAVSWENDGVPYRWNVTGSSNRSSNGDWSINLFLDGYEFVRATLHSDGTGSFRIGWDLFYREHPFP
ncbi:MAG: hypothetical protein N2450_01115 [bacterium]|nr:hypothetical protein [bacterium]